MTTKFTAQTFAWLRQVNTDRHLLAIDLKVAVELTRYFREKDQGGRAYPAAKTLADAIGLSERSVRRSIDRLLHAGHLYVIPGKPGRGCSAQYWMLEKTGTATPVFDGQKTGIRDRQKTGIRGKKTGTATPEILREPIRDGECLRTPPSPGERDRASRESNPSIGGAADAAPDLPLEIADTPEIKTRKIAKALGVDESTVREDVAGNPARGRKNRSETKGGNQAVAGNPAPVSGADAARVVAPKRTPEGECAASSELQPPAVPCLNQERTWRELRAVWDRGWASDDTPKALAIGKQAFAKACELAAPGEILEAARTWIAAADAPRYLPPLPQWLAAQGWEKPPPTKNRERGYFSGNKGHNDRPPRRNGKVNVADIFFGLADEFARRTAS